MLDEGPVGSELDLDSLARAELFLCTVWPGCLPLRLWVHLSTQGFSLNASLSWLRRVVLEPGSHLVNREGSGPSSGYDLAVSSLALPAVR